MRLTKGGYHGDCVVGQCEGNARVRLVVGDRGASASVACPSCFAWLHFCEEHAPPGWETFPLARGRG